MNVSKASQALKEANKRLLALRAERPTVERDRVSDPVGLPWGEDNGPAGLTVAQVAQAGVGWGDRHLTAALVAHEQREGGADAVGPMRAGMGAWVATVATGLDRVATVEPEPVAHKEWAAHVDDLIVLYPSLTVAMLKHEKAAAGRLWLLLRYFDQRGAGWLDLGMMRAILCEAGAFRLCGQRRLRQLLGQGQDLFWTWDKGADRVWLRSAARVAAELAVDRLTGRAVAVPVAHLLKGMGATRAALYGAFHVGRIPKRGSAAPISRAALTSISGASVSSQIRYEQVEGIVAKANYAIGQAAGPDGALANRGQFEADAYKHGSSYFTLVDYKGIQGGKGGTSYSAWQLPNSYKPTQGQQRGKGRQRAINKRLTDLRFYEGVGNGLAFDTLYHPTAQAAVKGASKGQRKAHHVGWGGGDPDLDYWRMRASSNGSGLWRFFYG